MLTLIKKSGSSYIHFRNNRSQNKESYWEYGRTLQNNKILQEDIKAL